MSNGPKEGTKDWYEAELKKRDEAEAATAAELKQLKKEAAAGGKPKKDAKPEKTETMVWPHAIGAPDSTRKIYAYDGVAGKDGYYRCEVPVSKLKNESLRINKLVTEEQWKNIKEVLSVSDEFKGIIKAPKQDK